MWWNWLPWRFVVSRLARARGFVDPIALLSRLHRFAQPSEVTEPIELLRAGVVFHARGLINARAIQHNLDWVWPYWVERQFDPLDPAFVPRAFSITHVNLTHRNWTAVGLPDRESMPIVDPRGLVTPRLDGWSVDAWILPDGGDPLLPSREEEADQRLRFDDGLAVETRVGSGELALRGLACVEGPFDAPACRIELEGSAPSGWLAVSIRPTNPEGISFIHRIEGERRDGGTSLRINDEVELAIDAVADRLLVSSYRDGDVLFHAAGADVEEAGGGENGAGGPVEIRCDVGLATAAALFRIEADRARRRLTVRVPLEGEANGGSFVGGRSRRDRAPETGAAADGPATEAADLWNRALAGRCRLRVPDGRTEELFEAASRYLILHAPGDVYPGPYTYKRFWFRDAAFVLHGLAVLGLLERVVRILASFPDRQERSGYFRSQEGEWDSNGAAIWIVDRVRRLRGETPADELVEAVDRGARWIARKRLSDDLDELHAGLMPAGFSAEHLGPNDYYYWDDFWSVAGLEAAAELLETAGRRERAAEALEEARRLRRAVDRSLERAPRRGGGQAVPASPHRRMDAGAVGSLAAGYPLRLWSARDPRLLATAEYLMESCRVRGGFFQDMIHSGINPYLTLHLAQVLLRAGDRRQVELVRTVAELASPTGQWPEAVHPRTGGGCMGDGQHMWAAAEWVLMMRAWFLREEDDGLVLASGLPAEWLRPGRVSALGPTPTPWGPVEVEVEAVEEAVRVRWEGEWRDRAPRLEIRLPGAPTVTPEPGRAEASVPRSRFEDRPRHRAEKRA